MSATSASIAAGGDHVEFDLIVAQHRFSGVSAPGEGWVHPVTGIYALTYRHAWDSFEGGGTVRLELDGVLVPEGVIMAGSSGREGLGSLFYRATTGSTGKVKVTHGSASAQTCSATIRLAITDPDPVTTSAPAGWDLVFSADAWGMVFDGTNWWTTEGNSGDTVTKRNASGVALDSFDARMGGRGRGITFDGTDLWVTGSHDDTQPTNPSALKRFSTGGVLQETITTVAVGDANMGVVSAGSDLWFTEHGNSKLVKVSGGAVAAQYSVPTNPRGLALYDSRLWLITGGRILRAYNLSGVATGDTVDLSGLTNSPTGVWIDGAGQLYIACDADGVYEYQGVLP